MAKVRSSQFKPAEYLRSHFAATPDAATTVDEILAPEYWAGTARECNVGDRIDVLPADRTFFAQLLVVAKTHNSLTVVKLSVTDLPTLAVEPEGDGVFNGHRIDFRGPSQKWAVTRIGKAGKDDKFLRDGFADAEAARDYVKGQLSAHGQVAA